MTEQEPSPSTLVDDAVDECIEEVKKGFKGFEYAEEDLTRLRAAHREDFERLLGNDRGEVRWGKAQRRVRVAAYEVGRTAHSVARLDGRSMIRSHDIRVGLEFVPKYCTVGDARAAYCEILLDLWDELGDMFGNG